MTDIVDYKLLTTEDLKKDVLKYKYNPASIQRTILNHLQAITNNQVDIVDPTNPFIFLLESSSVNTAAAIEESMINTRKQYSVLSRDEDDLYMHMSDKDYINKFSTPASTTFKIMIDYNDLLNKMVKFTNNSKKATIPRNTQFTINDIIFSLQYPIDIIKYDNGILQIYYDASQISPIKNIRTILIDYSINKDSNGMEWLLFEFDVDQFYIDTAYYTAQSSEAFIKNIAITDKYYYCRVFYQNVSNKWVEINTTYTDQVFDSQKPTAIIKIFNNYVSVYIPQIYMNSDLIDGNIRIDIYQTKGYIYTNLSNYKLTAFNTYFKAIDEINDINDYTNALVSCNYLSYSDKIVMGGSEGITFENLRDLVINHAVGDQFLPITNVQLASNEYINDFQIIENVDVITNRIFLANKNLPNPVNKNLITPANIGINSFITRLDDIKILDNVYNNGDRITIASENIFEYKNGILSIVDKTSLDNLKTLNPEALVSTINESTYVFNPFYYVLDNTKDEFQMKAYHLDNPSANNLSSINSNPTLALKVNILSFTINKTTSGYTLYILTKSDDFYKKLDDSYVNVQLAFIPYEEKDYAYLNGRIHNKINEERVYAFDIETNYDINDANNIIFTNFKMYEDVNILTDSLLKQKFIVLFSTNSVPQAYIPIPEDSKLGRFILPKNSALITIENIELTFGYYLKQLWTRCKTIPVSTAHATYTENVPAIYEEDIYKTDPETGSIFTFDENGELVYDILHYKGEIMRDSDNKIIYKYKKGETILNSGGALYIGRYIDLLLIEAEYLFAEPTVYNDYKKEVINILLKWIYEDLATINDNLLEQTKIYFHPKKVIGDVAVYIGNGEQISINSKQNFLIEVYITNTVYNNIKIINELEKTISIIVYNNLQKTTVSISDIVYDIKKQLGNHIISVKISNLGGSNNYESLMLVNNNEKLSLAKKLYIKDNNQIFIEEGITIKFIEHGQI